MALSAEAGELLEIFQWLTEAQSRDLPPEAHAAASEEIADVLLYLIRLSDKLGIDPVAAANAQARRERREVSGRTRRAATAKKYTEL